MPGSNTLACSNLILIAYEMDFIMLNLEMTETETHDLLKNTQAVSSRAKI